MKYFKEKHFKYNLSNMRSLLLRVDKEYVKNEAYLGKLLLLRSIFKNYYKGSSKSWEDSIMEGLETLPEHEKKILILRYGLNGKGLKTLASAGKELGISRERVRQLEAIAIRRLNHPSRRLILLGMSWQRSIQEANLIKHNLLSSKLEHNKL
jgi:DNA-directed RNA polymerase sigma subunit (sigma70/sigma32)